MRGRILTIAGSDSGGGAGVQADIKTITALGGFGMTAITALTAQNTCGVFGVHPVPAAFVSQQIRVVLEDIGADCCKTGMLLNAEIVHAVADVMQDYAGLPLVLDPVMVSTSGTRLAEMECVEAIKERLLPRSTVVTPNILEAAILSGMAIETLQDMQRAARRLQDLGASAVLLKGGHLPCQSDDDQDRLYDLLLTECGEDVVFSHPRQRTPHTHGTGCTLASAVATGLAQGHSLERSVKRATDYLQKALSAAPGLGQGHGPVDHGITIAPAWLDLFT